MNYTDRLFPGKRAYELRDKTIFASGTTSNGSKFEVTLEYAELNPTPERIWTRSPLFWLGITIVSMASGSIFALSVFQAEDKDFLLAMAYVFGVIGLVLVAASFRQIEIARFKFLAGIPALDICRAGPAKAQFDTFLTELKGRIEAQKPNKAPEPTTTSVMPRATEGGSR
jgi:hypothetical protein